MKDSHLACQMSDFDENEISTDTREQKSTGYWVGLSSKCLFRARGAI
jgi:hypothetical protein